MARAMVPSRILAHTVSADVVLKNVPACRPTESMVFPFVPRKGWLGRTDFSTNVASESCPWHDDARSTGRIELELG